MDVAHKEAQDLRALHANIKGTLDDGAKYFALNPKTFRIVPDTFLDAVIRVREDLGKPLTDSEKEKLYQDYIGLCLMFGIPETLQPALERSRPGAL